MSHSASPNPYQFPAQQAPPSGSALAEKVSQSGAPVSLRAASFSALAPFVLFLVFFLMTGLPPSLKGTTTEYLIHSAFVCLTGVTSLAAFGSAFVGLSGGIARRAGGTIILAVMGLVLNGPIVAWAGFILVDMFHQA